MVAVRFKLAVVALALIGALVGPIDPAVAIGSTPSITGTPQFGSTLSADPGSGWNADPLAYEWKRTDNGSSLANTSTWDITSDTVGLQVTVTVSGNDSNGDPDAQTSAPVTITAAALTAGTPTVSGSAIYGRTLTAGQGTWTAGATLANQWVRVNASSGSALDVPGATGGSYLLGLGDIGYRIKVRVDGSKAGYDPASRFSALSAVVTRATLASSMPAITAHPRVGATASTSPGSWTAGTTFRYQWAAGGKAISGATGRTFVPRPADVGKQLVAYVTGSKPGYTAVRRASAKSAAVTKGILVGPVPTISGAARLGSTLTATVGTWTAGSTRKYEWLMDGQVVKSGVLSLYLGSAAWKGKHATFRVTASKTGYITRSRTSSPTSAITVPGRTDPYSNGECPSWAPIKGNADSGIYHMPGQRFYDATFAEDCFSNESTAQAYGYRKAKV